MMIKRSAVFFIFFAVCCIYFYTYRLIDIPPIWHDEIVHVKTAKHIATEGRLWCDFYAFKFNEGKLFNLMPLHPVLLGVFGRLCGFSFLSARLFYVFLSMCTLCALYFLACKMFSKKIAFFSVLFLAASHIFFINSRQVMPQIPATLFAVLATLFFYLGREKPSKFFFIFSGIFAALAYLAHPTGLGVFIALGFLFLYERAAVKYFAWYALSAFIIVLPYLSYVLLNFPDFINGLRSRK